MGEEGDSEGRSLEALFFSTWVAGRGCIRGFGVLFPSILALWHGTGVLGIVKQGERPQRYSKCLRI